MCDFKSEIGFDVIGLSEGKAAYNAPMMSHNPMRAPFPDIRRRSNKVVGRIIVQPFAAASACFRRRDAMKSELMGCLKLGNVWVFLQLIQREMRTKNQLYKKPNIA